MVDAECRLLRWFSGVGDGLCAVGMRQNLQCLGLPMVVLLALGPVVGACFALASFWGLSRRELLIVCFGRRIDLYLATRAWMNLDVTVEWLGNCCAGCDQRHPTGRKLIGLLVYVPGHC